MRIFSATALLLLAATGCGSKGDDRVAAAAPDDRIECAMAGSRDFARTCAIERSDGGVITLRHADGGFVRIDLAADGTISTADGSSIADGKLLPDGRFELVIGDNRYRLPPRK